MTKKTGRIIASSSSFLLASAMMFFLAQAAPTIGSVDFLPSSSLWIGETPNVSVSCTEAATNVTVSSVVVQTVGQDGLVIPNATLSLSGSTYYSAISPSHFTYPNNFTATATCTNSLGQQATMNGTFTMSNFTVELVRTSPTTVLVGDRMEFDVLVKSNGANLTSGPNFTLKVDGNVTAITTPGYDQNRGWIVFLSAFPLGASHSLSIISGYGRAQANASFNLTAYDAIISNATLFTMLPFQTQLVVSEFTNRRTESTTTNMSIRVYAYNGSDLVDRALYQDSSFTCAPNCTRKFNASFVPNDTGYFFAKTTVPFNSSATFEGWAVWIVLQNDTPNTTEFVRIKGPQGQDFLFANNLTKVFFPSPRMELSYVTPELYTDGSGRLVLSQDDSLVFEVNVRNVGDTILERLKMHFSVPAPLEVSASPGTIGRIVTLDDFEDASNSSFLVSVRAPPEAQPGEYLLYFKIVADEVTTDGRMTVVVLPREFLSVEDIRQRITSYGIIIYNLEQSVADAKGRGVDTSGADGELAKAKSDFDDARSLFNQGDMSATRDLLEETREGLERATLYLESADIYTFRLPQLPLGAVAEGAAASVAIALYVYWRRWRNRRPRLLKGIEQEKES